MSCALRDIEKWCGVNNAGIREINLIVPSDVYTAPAQYYTPNLDGSIELVSGAQVYNIAFDRRSASFTEKLITNERFGDYYQQTLQFSIRRDRVEVADLIERMRNRRVHVLYTDKNGLQKFVRNMRAAPETQTGAAPSDRNGSLFQFVGQSEKKAPFMNQEIGNVIVEGDKIILVSPSGQRWLLAVDNCGAVVTIPVESSVTTESITVPLYLGDDGEIISGP